MREPSGKKNKDDCENAMDLLKNEEPKIAHGSAASSDPTPQPLAHVQSIAPHTTDGPPSHPLKDVDVIPPGEATIIALPVVVRLTAHFRCGILPIVSPRKHIG